MNDTHPLDVPERLTVSEGNGGMPKVIVTTPWSTAEIYLHGAHVSHFQKLGEPPMLFMSGSSAFAPGNPIRGGVPIIFPWFGGRDGFPAHGYARTAEWSLNARSLHSDGSISLFFRLLETTGLDLDYIVTIGETLVMELVVKNVGTEDTTFETCLHTYFQIGSIDTVSVRGLTGVSYLDKVLTGEFSETGETIHIGSEVDRVYYDTTATVEIIDPTFGRIISVKKSGSVSTVVWNPWVAKSKAMPDFGDEEYLTMICVESGNVGKNQTTLTPNDSTSLKVELASKPLN